MALVPQARASALPGRTAAPVPPSPRRRVVALARSRGDDTALVVETSAGPESRSWSEVARTVDRAAAGLLRSGLRTDQIVLSLLPSPHSHPELDIALRAVGAVVIHASPSASPDDLARALDGVDVRLVVSEAADDLDRLAGLRFDSAQMFAVGSDSGWHRLLTLGHERLVMDPDAVTRVDTMVDPDGAAPRLLQPGQPIGRHAAVDHDGDLLQADGVTLLVGDHGDDFVHTVRDAHLVSGGVLVHVDGARDLALELARVRPTTLALAADATGALAAAMSTVSGRDLRAWFGGNLAAVVVDGDLPGAVRTELAEIGAPVVAVQPAMLLPAELPERPVVVTGDASDLPRRSRREPGREFQLENDRPPELDEPEASAFVLPSLPLFGGESFLDKLLMSRAAEVRP